MVSRRLSPARATGRLSARWILLAVLLAVGSSALLAPVADAASTRVSITEFLWSKNPEIDLGESVTWDFIGPDLQHSVTGQAPNATQWDSDPDTNVPFQPLGREYKVTFDEPGTYLFVCKVHSSVRGTVTVSNTPGDPDSDPGPRPAPTLDIDHPYMDEYFFTADGEYPSEAVAGPGGKGIGFRFAINERGFADADYYRIQPRFRWRWVRKVKVVKKRVKGKVRKVRKVTRVRKRFKVGTDQVYAGYTEWETHVGYNLVQMGARSDTFPNPKPGNYVAVFRVTDESHNVTKPVRVKFKIRKR